MSYDVCVIGLGRIGLPLALSFADAGLSVLGVDNDTERLDSLRAKRMPFKEPGTDELLDRVQLDLSARAADAAQADAIVLTLGTPAMSHIEIDMGAIRAVLDDLLPLVRDRSADRAALDGRARERPSSSPATSRSTAGSASARTCSSRTCPSASPPTSSWRRSARCRASWAASARRPASAPRELFEPLGAPIVQTTPVQAELAKIWTNILRYATFALPNLLMMDCERYGANVFDVIELINRDYPRGGMKAPGLHRRHLPAQGLRVLRGALFGARHAAGGLARARDGAAVPRRRHQAPARRVAARAQHRGARPGLQVQTPTTSATRSRTS